MAGHGMALNLPHMMPAYYLKYSVPDCGMLKTFHT